MQKYHSRIALGRDGEKRAPNHALTTKEKMLERQGQGLCQRVWETPGFWQETKVVGEEGQ